MEHCSLIAWIALAGWILTVIGWIVVNQFSNGRETRKEIRSEIDKLHNELSGLLTSCHNYYCSDKKNERKNAELQITSAFNKLDGLIERLEEIANSLKLQKKLNELYEAVTGGDFGSDTANRNDDVYTEKCQRFALLAENLKSASENWFRKKYH